MAKREKIEQSLNENQFGTRPAYGEKEDGLSVRHPSVSEGLVCHFIPNRRGDIRGIYFNRIRDLSEVIKIVGSLKNEMSIKHDSKGYVKATFNNPNSISENDLLNIAKRLLQYHK